MQQIPLDIELKTDNTFDNFIIGENQLLLMSLKSLNINNHDFIFFHGSQKSGKTHILQAIAHQAADSDDYQTAYIPLDADFLSPQMLAGLEYFDCVCLDNLETVLEMENAMEWQTSLFNLYNQFKELDKSLIISANNPPANLDLSLADLKSRLSAMFIHAIKPLSDEEKLSFLITKAGEKGISLNDDVAKYLLAHQQRDLASLTRILDRLDKASLQAKRKLTIPFIKTTLNSDAHLD